VFSTSKKIARRRAGNGRSGSGGRTRAAKRASGLDRTMSLASTAGSTSTGSGWGSTDNAFTRDGSRLTRDGFAERGREFRPCFGAPALDRGGRF
jgi:hypothetical protein